MMNLKQFSELFEVLSNKTRIELYEYILANLFVSKSELALKFDLHRASLNHHLQKMLDNKLVREKKLIVSGRKQTFILPSMNLKLHYIQEFFKKNQAFSYLYNKLDTWLSTNISIKQWQEITDDLKEHGLNDEDAINALELRLFPTIRQEGVTGGDRCIICRTEGSSFVCSICEYPICKTHAHIIQRNADTIVTLCPNCVERWFG